MNAPFAPPKSRNDPCPCGSGKRYKHCHGSETPPADTYVAPDPALDPLERARAAIRAGRHADAVAILDTAQAGEHGDPAALRLLGEALRPIDLARSRTYLAARARRRAGRPGGASSSSATSTARLATSQERSRISSGRSCTRPITRRS
jgi:hypothetical protein